jgi:hypothetical protein
MRLSKLILPIIAVFVLVFIYGYVVHGLLLSNIYQQTPQLWRTCEEMHSYFPIMLISELSFAIIFTLFFAYLQEGMRVSLKGWQYGLGIGATFAAIQFGIYAYMPISLTLSLLWVADALIEPVLSGLALSCIYKR